VEDQSDGLLRHNHITFLYSPHAILAKRRNRSRPSPLFLHDGGLFV